MGSRQTLFIITDPSTAKAVPCGSYLPVPSTGLVKGVCTQLVNAGRRYVGTHTTQQSQHDMHVYVHLEFGNQFTRLYYLVTTDDKDRQCYM